MRKLRLNYITAYARKKNLALHQADDYLESRGRKKKEEKKRKGKEGKGKAKGKKKEVGTKQIPHAQMTNSIAALKWWNLKISGN